MGVMIPMKRERMLTIRVTDDEHARLLERCEGKAFSPYASVRHFTPDMAHFSYNPH